MRSLTKALAGMIPAIVIISIISYLTVNNCTDEQLKWTPLVIVITMVLVIAVGFINAVLQDMEDKPESISKTDQLDTEEIFQFGCDPECKDCESLINARLKLRR